MMTVAMDMDAPAKPRPGRRDETGAQCIHRSLGVMRLLASSAREGLKLVEIAAALDLSHPTAHRILKALEEEGVVERVLGSRRYTIGVEAAWLGLGAVDRFPITAAAGPFLEKLSALIGDTVFLAVPSQNDSVYAAKRMGFYPVQSTTLSVGARRPLGVSVAGRAMLAFMPERRMDTVLRENSERYEAYGCTPQSLLEGIGEARRSGYLCADSLTARDKRAISAPVFNMAGAPIAAVSVIAHHSRLPASRIPRLVPMLRDAAQDISRSLSESFRA